MKNIDVEGKMASPNSTTSISYVSRFPVQSYVRSSVPNKVLAVKVKAVKGSVPWFITLTKSGVGVSGHVRLGPRYSRRLTSLGMVAGAHEPDWK